MDRQLTELDVSEIAASTCIGLTQSELESMTKDLNAIIESLDPILNFDDLEGVKPLFHPIGSLVNVMRDDCEGSSFTQEEALANATNTQDGSFLVPSILGGGDQ